MKELKVVLVIVFLITSIILAKSCFQESKAEYYGEFGDGTTESDTLYIPFVTWDTTGFSADADTYFVRRFYHGTLIDSTFGVAATNRVRTGYYEVPKRAFSANYGQYEVCIEWHKQTKVTKIKGNYKVKNIYQPQLDQIKYLYVRPDVDATPNGNALSPSQACSLKNITARLSGAKKYVVLVSSGTYMDISLIISVNYVSFWGEGIAQTIIEGHKGVTGVDDNYPTFKISGTIQGFEVKDMTIRGYRSTSGGGLDSLTAKAFRIPALSGWHIHDCIVDGYMWGIHTCGGTDWGKAENCKFTHIYSAAVYLEPGAGLDMEGNTVKDCIIDSLFNSSSIGIDIHGLGGRKSSRNLIYRNIINANWGKGISIGDDTYGNMIVNNFIRANGDSGIFGTGANLAKNVLIGNITRSRIDSTFKFVQTDFKRIYDTTKAVVNAFISVEGNVVDSASNSASEFKTDLTNAVDGHYNEQLIIFTSGTNAGQVRIIAKPGYFGSSKYIKVTPAFEVEPTAGDDFKILYLLGREMGIKKIFE